MSPYCAKSFLNYLICRGDNFSGRPAQFGRPFLIFIIIALSFLWMAENNKLLTEKLISGGYLKSPDLVRAFRAIDRKDFVPKEFVGEAYGNYPLPIGRGQTISQPLTVAFMLELLRPQTGEKILDVGFGSGWTTALLASIVGARGKVYGLEIVPELFELGKKNLKKFAFNNVGLRMSSGWGGWSEKAPFDRILVSAAAEKIPEKLLEQLIVGGRIVAPIGQSIVVLDKISEKEFKKKEYFSFSFVPLVPD